LNTGIQRVVRNIIKESKQIAEELNIESSAVIVVRGHFTSVDKVRALLSLRTLVIGFLKKVYQKFHSFLRSSTFLGKIVRFRPHHWLKRPALIPLIYGVLDVLLLPVYLVAYFNRRVIPKQGDLILLLDSSWVYPIWPAVKNARRNGAIVGLVVYDLIQVTHPHLFTSTIVERFQKWFDQAVENVDFFIAISKTTRDKVAKYAESKRPCAKWAGRFESFRLGSVIDNVVRNGEIRDELKEIFGAGDKPDTYLTVGTIEPRKNHNYLIDAFDEAWQKCPDAKLCVVGRPSWLGEGILKRITSHSRYGKRLFMFNDLSDTELDYCYTCAKALVLPSEAEGFGLPLVEALYKGLPVLASDIPIFREVGKEFCAYFDISKPPSLAKMIVDIEKEGKMPEVRKLEELQLSDWKDSCRELLNKAVSLYEITSV
jgi:alpha-1,2-rhamnosyltransferase